MPIQKDVWIEWQTVGAQRHYFVRAATRSRPWIWFRDGDVPRFDEQRVRFRVEKRHGRWVAVERLNFPIS